LTGLQNSIAFGEVEAEKIDCTKLKNAFAALKSNIGILRRDIVRDDEALENAVLCGVIQAFEVAYEVAVSFIIRKLKTLRSREEVSSLPKAKLLNLAEQCGIIQSAERWHEFHSYRNSSSHNYNADLQGNALKMATNLLVEGENLQEYLSRD
jgi:hypothetical protein